MFNILIAILLACSTGHHHQRPPEPICFIPEGCPERDQEDRVREDIIRQYVVPLWGDEK